MLCRHRACTLSKHDGSPGSKPARFFFSSYQAEQRRPVPSSGAGRALNQLHFTGESQLQPKLRGDPRVPLGIWRELQRVAAASLCWHQGWTLQGMGQSGVTFCQATDGGGGGLFVLLRV